MPPRTLAALAHALSVAPDLDAALVALGEGLAEVDRAAQLALLRYDGRREMLRDRLTPAGGRIDRSPVETTFDHLPAAVRMQVAAGGVFVDLGDRSEEYAQLLGFHLMSEGGLLALRGLRFDGALAAIVALYEPRKFFGSRASERLAPSVALFDLGFARFCERGVREEAVRTLEEVTQRVHGEYVKRLGGLEAELLAAREDVAQSLTPGDAKRVVELERGMADAKEEARRSTRKSDALDSQIMAAVGQLEAAHIELHRRSELLRQKTRTLYLIERTLGLYDTAEDPRDLVDGLLALVGEDMQAQRCSLMLVAPEPDMLYLAAARGIAPHVAEGTRIAIGEGVAGKVAATREPLLVEDVSDAPHHPLLADQYFTTGSFISFPLVLHDSLLGVVNLTNRFQQGMYLEEDMERVRLLGMVLAIIAAHARLPERLYEMIGAP